MERIKTLLESANEAAKHTRNVFLVFLLVGLYIAIFIGSTTHEQLFRGSGILLPLLDVELPVTGVYTIVPPLFVILHFNLLLQFYFLSRKLHHLDRAISLLDISVKQDEIRDWIFPLFFSYAVVGYHLPRVVHVIASLMVWLVVALLPVLLLLWAQLAFLPYHSWEITWFSHRASIIVDIILLWLFLPMIGHQEGEWRRRNTSDSWKYPGQVTRVLAHGMLTVFALWICFFVFLIPDHWLDRNVGFQAVISGVFGPNNPGPRSQPWANRNIVIWGADLVAEAPAPEIEVAGLQNYTRIGPAAEYAKVRSTKGLNLLGRDLRYAYLRKVDLTNANLRLANLHSADLRGAHLVGAILECAVLVRADLRESNFTGADLEVARMESAVMREAQLSGADLEHADLTETNLKDARLDGADMAHIQLEGAMLESASLAGADLSKANLRNAALTNARFTGADLQYANIEGANFTGADLDLVDLRNIAIGGEQARSNRENVLDEFKIQCKMQDNRDPDAAAAQNESASCPTPPTAINNWVVRANPPGPFMDYCSNWSARQKRWHKDFMIEIYYARLTELVTKLACSNYFVAHRMFLKVKAAGKADPKWAKSNARALLDGLNNCSDVPLLSASEWQKLRELAGPRKNESSG